MARRAIALGLLLLCAACTAEHTTVIASPPAHAVLIPSDAELIVQSREACDSYGLLRGTAPYDRCVANEFAARRPG